MKSFRRSMILAAGGVLLLSGLASAQTTTLNFKADTCNTMELCGVTGGTNRLLQENTTDGSFFFQEEVIINGKRLNHLIVRGRSDASTGSTFSQETFTPGGAPQGATNTSSTDQLTFRQSLKANGGIVDSLVKMDNLGIINKTAEEMVDSTKIHITQSVIDPSFGLNRNLVTLRPSTGATPPSEFTTHIEQDMTDPTSSAFTSNLRFDTGQQATVNQSF